MVIVKTWVTEEKGAQSKWLCLVAEPEENASENLSSTDAIANIMNNTLVGSLWIVLSAFEIRSKQRSSLRNQHIII